MTRLEGGTDLGDQPTLKSDDDVTEPSTAGRIDVDTNLGRYRLLKILGAGGMGVVYLGHDPELDRKVAIKVLRGAGSGTGAEDTDAVARMRREAVAMAKLAHPNIVNIFDVGTHAGQVYLAMEYLEGQTLTDWLKEPRTWREIIGAFRAAARGLGAAHERQIIHRDVKPDNIFVPTDGRVRVMDLGLALPVGNEPEAHEPVSGLSDADVPDMEETRLTKTGVAMGTINYMAAEQFAGQDIDARTDVFALCVSMYRALWDTKPFAGDRLAQIVVAVTKGAIKPPPKSDVPERIQAAVLRGLARNPDERWQSMAELEAALAFDPNAARKKWAVGGLLAVALATGVGGASALGLVGVPECGDATAQLEGIWDDGVRERVRAAFSATGVASAAPSFEMTAVRLDTLGDQWLEAKLEGCETNRAGEISDTLLDLRTACLAEVREQIAASAEVLARADPMIVANAIDLMPPGGAVDRCTDNVRLTEGPAPPADGPARERWLAARRALASAEMEIQLGRTDAARSHLQAAEKAQGERSDPHLAGLASLLEGQWAQAEGEYLVAAEHLEKAASSANEIGDEVLRARALIELVYLYADQLHDPAKADVAAAQAQATLQRAGDLPLYRAKLTEHLAVKAFNAGDFEAAERGLQQALASYATALPPDDVRIATVRQNLANTRMATGDFANAIEDHQSALTVFEREHGPEHPVVADTLNNLGYALNMTGRHDEALEVHRRSLTVREKIDGSADLRVANALNGIGIALVGLDRSAEAVPVLEPLLELRADLRRDPGDRAEAQFALARALDETDPERATQLGAEAQMGYSELAGQAAALEAISTWQRSRADGDAPSGD